MSTLSCISDILHSRRYRYGALVALCATLFLAFLVRLTVPPARIS